MILLLLAKEHASIGDGLTAIGYGIGIGMIALAVAWAFFRD